MNFFLRRTVSLISSSVSVSSELPNSRKSNASFNDHDYEREENIIV